jgi:hypothetical protein
MDPDVSIVKVTPLSTITSVKDPSEVILELDE